MALRVSLARPLLAAARPAPTVLRTAPLNRLRTPPRLVRGLGCVPSLLLPAVGPRLSGNARTFCELSQGTFRRICPDR